MSRFQRSVVAYWGMPEVEAQALLEAVRVDEVALWPINTLQELAALWSHLDENREVRVIWALCLPGGLQEPYVRLQHWYNGVDSHEPRLPSKRFEAICKWVQVRVAVDTHMAAPGSRNAVVSLGPRGDLRAMMEAAEDLMAAREETT